MTGAEHYTEAERLLAQAARCEEGVGGGDPAALAQVANTRAEAQVHATLAGAAAAALPAVIRYYGDDSDAYRDWAQAVGA